MINKNSESSLDDNSKKEKNNVVNSQSTIDNSFKGKRKSDNINLILIKKAKDENAAIMEKNDDVTEGGNTKYGEDSMINMRKFSLVKSEGDGTSTIKSTTREDSLLMEAKKDATSPSPSDYEGGASGNKISTFFNKSSSTDVIDSANLVNEGDSPSNMHSVRESLKKYLEMGNQYRLKANVLFKKNKFKDALYNYLNAVDCLNSLVESNRKHDMLNMTNVNWVRMECLNNISVCYLLLKDYPKVLDYTKEVLDINNKNFIALSYRAKALIALEEYKEALSVVKSALSIKYSKSLISMLKEVEDKINADKLEERRQRGEVLDVFEHDASNHENSSSLEENGSGSSDKTQMYSKSLLHSIFNSIVKFGKISFIACFQQIKKYKILILILLLIWVIVFRRRLKNKLLKLLRIKFN